MAKVYLVGAGCGDPGLLTLKGKKAIEEADVLIYDWLVNPALLYYAKDTCARIFVGKQAGNHAMRQEDINRLIVQKAMDGNVVVRLKGGDPYVFGRGGEEGESLAAHGIDFEVVPGISSATGGLAYAGIPVTHRGIATSFHVITGHRQEDGALDFAAYAKLKGTLVFLMGIGRIRHICDGLLRHGMSGHTPAAIVHRASTPYQKTMVGTLDTLADIAAQSGMTPPGLIVIGAVVAKRDRLNFFETKPLFGKRIVVTRARAQSSGLVAEIAALGGLPIEMPMIQVRPINRETLVAQIGRLDTYQYVIFTSENGVHIFFDALLGLGRDARAFGGIKVAAIGSGTAKALGQYGIAADYVPGEFTGEALVDMLQGVVTQHDRILIPRSQSARPLLVEALSKIARVTEIKTYETVRGDADYSEGKAMLAAGEIDYITFTSSSTVDCFVAEMGLDCRTQIGGAKIISIGPITTERIAHYGLKVYAQARKYTIDGMMEVLIGDD